MVVDVRGIEDGQAAAGSGGRRAWFHAASAGADIDPAGSGKSHLFVKSIRNRNWGSR